jgi:hypothetical protein
LEVLNRAMHMRDFIRLVESQTGLMLYHGTTTKNADQIERAGGLKPGSHWTPSEDIAAWFAKHKAADHGGEPLVISAPFSAFDESRFQPDLNLMDFPIPAHDADHEQRLNGLANPQQPTWEESLRLFDSVIYGAPLGLDKMNR